MKVATLLPHILRPARGGAAALILVFAVLLTVALSAGFVGIPLAAILLSWFFKYAYILFDHVVRGVDAPPTLDIQMVNPLSEQRPLAQVIIVAGVAAVVTMSASRLPWAVVWLLAASATLLLPASVAVLGLEGNMLKAVYPVALARMIWGLGVTYLQVVGVIAATVLMLWVLAKFHLWLPIELAIAMFAVLSLFSMLAGALYERRHELGLETWHSPERTAAVERAAEQKENQRVVTEAYGLARSGSHVKAWELLKSWLDSRAHAIEDYRWVCASAASWGDPRYANRLTEEFVDRLLALKMTGEALDTVAARLRVDKDFRPKSAATTLYIAQLAVCGGGAPGLARLLLSDFERRFAENPLLESATTLARQLGE